MSIPRSIPTEYNGIRFRSLLEASWAQLFDRYSLRWAYESESWAFGPALAYLPDFWLPETRTIVEVKGVLDSRSTDKIAALYREAEINHVMVVLAVSPPGTWAPWTADGPGAYHTTLNACDRCSRVSFFDAGGCRFDDCRRNVAPKPWLACETLDERLAWLRWWGAEMARAGRIDEAEEFAAEAVRLRSEAA